MTQHFAAPGEKSTPIHVIETRAAKKWFASQDELTRNWVLASGFHAGLGQILRVPDSKGRLSKVLFGWGAASERKRGRFHFARAASELEGAYHLASGMPRGDLDEAALGWILERYRFTKYTGGAPNTTRLKCPDKCDPARLANIAEGEFLTRDLINTPASDMGPEQLERAAADLAESFGASMSSIKGDSLLREGFPMIHAVGRASASEPRLVEINWGDPRHPCVALVGKGVCFDTGGLDIKPSSSMGLMKKDMGGAAAVLGLARMIMGQKTPVRLRVLLPIVENSISASSFRPQDVLKSRKGLTVEINNTDAEGRLVLADALALVDEGRPHAIFCMATLTGAARVAVGPDIAPFYTDDDGLADLLMKASRKVADPLWRLPFHEPYESDIEPDIADLDNAPRTGFAGSITAALFLRRFVTRARRFAHFDIYGWSHSSLPGRPSGGVGQGARALFEAIPKILRA